MSSGSVKSSNKGMIRNAFESKKTYYGLSEAVVSFSSLSNKHYSRKNNYITSNIPFNELDPELKQILRQEFTDTLKS